MLRSSLSTLIIYLFLLIFLESSDCSSSSVDKIDPNLVAQIKRDFTGKELNYFSDIAFGTEWSKNNKNLMKWNKQEVLVSVHGLYDHQDSTELIKYLSEINSLITQTKLVLKSTRKADIDIYFSTNDKFSEVAFRPMKNRNVNGFFNVKHKDCIIYKAVIGISNSRKLERFIRNKVLKEEVTQILGLMNDSRKYVDSIFYELLNFSMYNDDFVKKYSAIDRKVILLLYNYNLPHGLTKKAFDTYFYPNNK